MYVTVTHIALQLINNIIKSTVIPILHSIIYQVIVSYIRALRDCKHRNKFATKQRKALESLSCLTPRDSNPPRQVIGPGRICYIGILW